MPWHQEHHLVNTRTAVPLMKATTNSGPVSQVCSSIAVESNCHRRIHPTSNYCKCNMTSRWQPFWITNLFPHTRKHEWKQLQKLIGYRDGIFWLQIRGLGEFESTVSSPARFEAETGKLYCHVYDTYSQWSFQAVALHQFCQICINLST